MKYYLGVAILVVVGLVSLTVFQYTQFYDNRLHIVFCDVGQGDAIVIKSPRGHVFVYDGGPNVRVLDCLSNTLPFWKRDLAAIFLSHPHSDHYTGLINVVQSYSTKHFITENISNDTGGFKHFQKLLQEQHLPPTYVVAGAKIQSGDGLTLSVVGPTQAFLDITSPGGTIGESSEFGSVELLVSFGQVRILLTGDSQASELTQAQELGLGDIDLLHIPHHGSKTGLSPELVTSLQPEVAVISVGKSNKYGHPAPETLELLKAVKVLRTDKDGQITLVSDGKSLWEETKNGYLK